MEKIVADLDFHGCLLRGARPNRILNRYDRKRERDRGQSAFCVPINHFSPPPYPMNRSPSSWSKPFTILDHPHPYGSTTRVLASRNAGDIVTFKLTHYLMPAFPAPNDQPDACSGSVAERHRWAGVGLHF
jgi:hypothetical protein